ncbi:MAG TPA: hypothetical protein VNZ52_01110 [Candidatus Thermoplasmatota archaeon]|nr:hypothetical protein [Candidatus Thermoplasmatota archaeon]
MRPRRLAGALFLVVLAAPLLAGFAAAQDGSSSTSDETATSSYRQTIDIPRENVLAALALGCCDDIEEIANIDRSYTATSRFSRSADLSDDDVFSLLALDGDGSDLLDLLLLSRNGGFGRSSSGFDSDDFEEFDDFEDDTFRDGFGRTHRFGDLDDEFGIADVNGNEAATRTLSQRVSLDREDVFLALALGEDDDLWDIADIDRTRTETRSLNRDVNFDEDDAFLWLALDE